MGLYLAIDFREEKYSGTASEGLSRYLWKKRECWHYVK